MDYNNYSDFTWMEDPKPPKKPKKGEWRCPVSLLLAILFVKPVRDLFGNVNITYLKTALFATFMMAITFNGFNARTSHLNPFEGLGRNKNFIIVMLSIIGLQYLFVTFGGKVLEVEPLTLRTWAICALLAFLVIPIDIIRKLIFVKR